MQRSVQKLIVWLGAHVVVEVGVGHSDPVSTMRNVKKTIKVVFSKT